MDSILPVAAICTKSRISEFLLTRFSLEQYHTCRWVVAVDRESQEILSKQFPNDAWLCVIDAEGSHITHQFESFMRVVLNKMAIMRECIDRHGWCFFVDSDLLFVGPMDLREFWRAPVTASDHHITRENIVERYGKYNVGFIGCRDKAFLNEWEYLTRIGRNTDALEQKPFEQVLSATGIPFSVFPEQYNVGWWRGAHDHKQFMRFGISEQGILFADKPMVNFHLHLDPKIGRGEDKDYAKLVVTLLENSPRVEHAAVLRKIGELFGHVGGAAYATA